MATDYDASRKSEDEQKEESLEARRLTSGEQDKTSGKVDAVSYTHLTLPTKA